MGKIIAVANQKGGVGKTTTCVNTVCALTDLKKRVLLCDFDPQGNATSGMGVSKKVSPSVYDVVIGNASADKAIYKTRFGDVMPASRSLSGAEAELMSLDAWEYRLKNALEGIRDSYDYIFIDCPPSLGLLTVNALCAADSVLVPVQCEYLALEGLSDLVNSVRIMRGGKNSKLELEGVLLTMYNSRGNLSLQVADEVKRFFPDKLYSVVVPRNVRLAEAPSHGMPVQYYDPSSKGADCYRELGREMLKRNNVPRETIYSSKKGGDIL